MNIETLQNPPAALFEELEEKITAFNEERWEVKTKYPLAIAVRDENGALLAGASARTFGLWLLIENLWVSEALRGQDMGSKILAQLEAAAIDRGCQFALLDTLNFQARPFYEKFNYQVGWVQPSYPATGCKYFMSKQLLSI
ncbi:GNAT family N-acetyltransferase [Iodobacter sp. LRB]|uniref:GNAT family N-acetyltransferase n=1 Tax=unclassified Iodobacter TaxID=235634 RepID=UPI000C0DB534|nr:GNAT family N-acetyltransferase [Iodobacter sp. BJB302]PHV00874.1 GNAT family N-acetyltransferase [Iodobacter sp. BJB302]